MTSIIDIKEFHDHLAKSYFLAYSEKQVYLITTNSKMGGTLGYSNALITPIPKSKYKIYNIGVGLAKHQYIIDVNYDMRYVKLFITLSYVD